MTGINIIATKNNKFHKKFNNVQKKMLHLETYKHKTLLRNKNIIIGFTGYKEYPISSKKIGDLTIFIEGMIYDKLQSEVSKFIFKNRLNLNEITEYLSKVDGEFIIYIHSKKNNTITIINDALGRLPLYYYTDGKNTAISREIKFILPFMESINFDKDSILQTLLYEFQFGNKTLIGNVYRLMPGTTLQVDLNDGYLVEETLHSINFDTSSKFESTETQVEKLKELYTTAWKNRIKMAGKRKIISSVSGGLDSRATLATINKINKNITGVTWLRPPNAEAEHAKLIAELFGVPLNVIPVSGKLGIEDYNRIINIKDGMNGTRMAFSLKIYDELIKHYGQNTFLCTGVYGGELLRDMRITSGLKTERSLVSSILNTNDTYKYDNETVSKMLGVNNRYIKNMVSEHLAIYPEKDLYRKYSHFKYEREFKWAGEGEDRQRMFLWSTTAFYAQPVYRYITYNIEESKKGMDFFVKFLKKIDKRTCEVNYFNDGTILTDAKQIDKCSRNEQLARNAQIRHCGKIIMDVSDRLKIKNLPERTMADDLGVIRNLAVQTLCNSKLAQSIFSKNATIEILNHEKSGIKINRILTILLYIKSIEEMTLK